METKLLHILIYGLSALAVIGFIVLAIVGTLKLAGAVELPKGQGFPYRKKARVLSLAEERFAHALLEAIGEDFFPLCKVRLADVLEVTVQGKGFYPAFNQVAQKHLDFLLCDPESSAPLLAIELDDHSHGGKRARERDAFKSQALAAAGLPLLRVTAAVEYDAEVLRRDIDTRLRSVNMPKQA